MLLIPLFVATALHPSCMSDRSCMPLQRPRAIMSSRAGVPRAASDPLPPRDPEVERATGGGWSSLLPGRRGLVVLGGLGLCSAFLGNTTLGRWLNEPLFVETAVEQEVDAAGTPYGPSTLKKPSGGLAILILYQVIARFARPRLEERAASSKAQREAQEPTVSDTTDGGTATGSSTSPGSAAGIDGEQD